MSRSAMLNYTLAIEILFNIFNASTSGATSSNSSGATSIANTTQQACNGSPALCNRSFSNVSFVGTHDSAFAGTSVSDNQNVNITAQLDGGIRFLQAQTHRDGNGTLSMCHTACGLLNTGPLTDYLGTVKTWMDANVDEVVMMLLVNGDNLGVGNFSSAFNSTGLQEYAYIPDTDPLPLDGWPTLGQLMSDGKRLVMFIGMFDVAYPPPSERTDVWS